MSQGWNNSEQAYIMKKIFILISFIDVFIQNNYAEPDIKNIELGKGVNISFSWSISEI